MWDTTDLHQQLSHKVRQKEGSWETRGALRHRCGAILNVSAVSALWYGHKIDPKQPRRSVTQMSSAIRGLWEIINFHLCQPLSSGIACYVVTKPTSIRIYPSTGFLKLNIFLKGPAEKETYNEPPLPISYIFWFSKKKIANMKKKSTFYFLFCSKYSLNTTNICERWWVY